MLENVDVDDDLLIQYVDSWKMRLLWLDEADINLKDANKVLIKTEYLKRLKYFFFKSQNWRMGTKDMQNF